MKKPSSIALAFVPFLVACQYELPLPSGAGGAGEGGAAPAFTLVVEPEAQLDATPSVLRLGIEGAPLGTQPNRIAIVLGEMSPILLRELQTDQVSAALTARIVPVLGWADAGGKLHVAPTVALAAGELYTVALSDQLLGATFRVAAAPPPVLPRIWPPAGLAGTASFGVWCGASPLSGVGATHLALEPAGAVGQLLSGVDGADARCVSFRGTDPPRGGTASMALPAVPGAVPTVTLDPRPFAVEAPPAPVPPLECEKGEVAFGPGCVRVLDDRLVGRAPLAPALWAVKGMGVDIAWSTNPSDPFVLTGLPASSAVALHVSAIDTAGRATRSLFHAHTSAPMPHVVLNEVLADAIGPEPAQEWVEIVNDGAVAADLTGFVLVDLGGETLLPAATLAPGAYALVVGEDFVESDGFDPAPAAGTLLLRVPRVGKSGLSNEGEPLWLRDASGATVSAFPPAPAPKSGLSVSRSSPGAPDALAGSFSLAAPTPGAPNGPPMP